MIFESLGSDCARHLKPEVNSRGLLSWYACERVGPSSKCGSPLWKYSPSSSSMAPNSTFLHLSLDTENAIAKQARTAEATEIVHLSRQRRRATGTMTARRSGFARDAAAGIEFPKRPPAAPFAVRRAERVGIGPPGGETTPLSPRCPFRSPFESAFGAYCEITYADLGHMKVTRMCSFTRLKCQEQRTK